MNSTPHFYFLSPIKTRTREEFLTLVFERVLSRYKLRKICEYGSLDYWQAPWIRPHQHNKLVAIWKFNGIEFVREPWVFPESFDFMPVFYFFIDEANSRAVLNFQPGTRLIRERGCVINGETGDDVMRWEL